MRLAVLAAVFAASSTLTAGNGFCADDAVPSPDKFEHADYIVFAEVERTDTLQGRTQVQGKSY